MCSRLKTVHAGASPSTRRHDIARFGNHKPRAEPDTTPLAVDPALYRRFVSDPLLPEFHVLQKHPVPATEADMRASVREDWKTYKAKHKNIKADGL